MAFKALSCSIIVDKDPQSLNLEDLQHGHSSVECFEDLELLMERLVAATDATDLGLLTIAYHHR